MEYFPVFFLFCFVLFCFVVVVVFFLSGFKEFILFQDFKFLHLEISNFANNVFFNSCNMPLWLLIRQFEKKKVLMVTF